jgi:ribosomal protein S8
MDSTFINVIKLNIEHRKKFVKMRINKRNFNLIKILIKFNVVKFAKLADDNVTLFFNYDNNKSFFKIKLIKKSTKRNSINFNEFKKNFLKNKQILIISTDRGFISTVDCVKQHIGGIPVLSLTLNA